MKKRNYSFRSFAGALAALLLVALLPSCSGGNEAEIHDLLASVPSDAQAVAVFNFEKGVEQAGGKVKDGKITDAGQLAKLLEISKKNAKSGEEDYSWLLSENSGVDCSAGAAFLWKGNAYFTMMLGDVKAFRANVDKNNPGEWKEAGKDLLVKGKMAIYKERLWMMDKSNAEEIANFMVLSEAQSFNTNPYAEKLAKSDDALAFWTSLDGLMAASGTSFGKQTQARMALGMFFKNANAIAGDANITKNGLELEATLVDKDNKTAKCELELSKIDVKEVAALGGDANMVVALAVSHKLVKQLMELSSSLGGAMPAMFTSLIEPIDGTMAAASELNPGQKNMPGFRGFITTNGNNNAALAQMLQMAGEVKVDGKILRVSKGSYGKGALNVSETAKAFDGAWLGVATHVEEAGSKVSPDVIFVLKPSDGGLKAKVTVSLK